ncbi:DUF6779 domain-containing protein [Actinophytocola gossypii]|uniref:DUF6779 domain-containing protein n=1 Tax=Actinophytocola gossypii TaxID=2812003 RepID=A0ABT2J4M6_9PSEU|nr:DUF6779 domain-containing protein [Actinophytocola gossypii]MCT2582544.1 hypothetical protein [Actinophytocola gossypii]
MNARRDSSDEPTRGSFGGRLLLSAAVVFALGATAVLILSEELKWLRLGIVAALWAALAGAFLAARYRRQVADQEDAAAERQERYELELEREIAARREYELEVTAEAKRKAEADARDDIAALRQELSGLRQTLESLLGGEFLVERYALRAESTRMRSIDDPSLKRLPPARPRDGDLDDIVPSMVQDAQTDLIERVQELHRTRPVEPEPRRPADFPLPQPPEPVRVEHPAEVSDRWFVPDGLGTDQPAQQPEPHPYAARQYVQRTRDTHQNQPNRHTVASGYMEPVSRPRAYQTRPDGSGYNRPPAPPNSPAESSGYGHPASTNGAESSGFARPAGYASPASPAESSGYGHPASTNGAESSGFARPAGHAPATNPAESSGYRHPARPTPAESSGYGHPARPTPAEPSGYGHPVRPTSAQRAESSGYSAPAPTGGEAPSTPDTGGRRRRAEGQPTWQEAHADEAAPSGSHAAGRSVSELLASHGSPNSPNTPRRRRRRRED